MKKNIKTPMAIYANSHFLTLLVCIALWSWDFSLDSIFYCYFDIATTVCVAMAFILPPDVGPTKPAESENIWIKLWDWSGNRRGFIYVAVVLIVIHKITEFALRSIF